ncbi:hypothetical protein [Pseudodonghicola xiamenensis]|uniref:PH domain-containing protein n=1 Tax=Pseudodonghicola xiamenensis TaxID=337702 RepID=A0A8J3H8B1_9RHOB|nr:hypothetical protein [Pseudodonghicola xiamenensis]GHG90367.1 hypothetical protein GCM10010961_20590 [Pseudodonghicola xiamenensis]
MPQDDILISVSVSPFRRWFGVGALVGFAGIVFYFALSQPLAPGWLAFLVLFGGLALWLAERMWRATGGRLELTAEGLRTDDGRLIAPIEAIAAVERGAFSFKPSNGFLIVMRRTGPRGWSPGLWWRLGRRIGVGGVTSAAQTKAMAQMIEAMILDRDQPAAEE